MNNIVISGRQEFMGIEIPVVAGGFGFNKKCISDKTIAEIHSMREPDVRRRISDNIKRFKENIDYIDLKEHLCNAKTLKNERVDEAHTLELLQNLGYAKQSITQAEHIYLLSERGYAKLIKIMDTDLAWEIHDKLIDEYFELREQKERDPLTIPQATETAKFLKEVYSEAGVDVRYIAVAVNTVYKVAGLNLILPIEMKENERKLYDQTGLAAELGILSQSGKPHAQAVGAILDKLKIPKEEMISTPYTNHGHSGVVIQYTGQVKDMLFTWLEENNYPKEVSKDGKKYKIKYVENSKSRKLA